MNEAVSHSHVTDPQAPVQAGTGDQYITTLILDALSPRSGSPRRDPRQIADDELRQLKRFFVVPPDFSRARETLRARSAVIVSGSPGCGRRTAAKMLLSELPAHGRTFHDLTDQSEEAKDQLLDHSLVGEEDRLFLDLTNVQEERCRALLSELPFLRTMVRNRNARLAVALAHDRDHLLGTELRWLRVSLDAPPAEEVLRRHLQVQGVEGATRAPVDDKLRRFLGQAPQRDIADLAVRVREEQRAARDSSSKSGLGSWITRALDSPTPYDADVGRIVSQAGTEQRALLLASAFLEHPRSDTLCRATGALLKTTSQAEGELPLLHHEALRSQLKQLKASVDDNGQVHLHEGYAHTVVTYFWDNYPPLRPSLRSWVISVAKQPWAEQHDRLALATEYARQRLRTGPPQDLCDLIALWTNDTSSGANATAPAAACVLREGIVHERHSGYFRGFMYDLAARTPDLRSPIAHVLIGVCTETMMVRFPDQALVRLHHLARQRNTEVRQAAQEALVQVTRSDNRLHRRLTDRIAHGPDRAARADAELFLRLADPARLTGDGQYGGGSLITSAVVREHLAAGWALVLKHLDLRDYGDQVVQWLNTALTQPRYADPLLDVLVGGAGQDAGALSRLHFVATRCWAASSQDPARAEILSALRRRIDLAQGIAPASSPPTEGVTHEEKRSCVPATRPSRPSSPC